MRRSSDLMWGVEWKTDLYENWRVYFLVIANAEWGKVNINVQFTNNTSALNVFF